MFGTDRELKDFSLTIHRVENDRATEQCRVWGYVSYTAEVDFSYETHDDTLGVDISLTPQKFDDLRELIRHDGVDDLEVLLSAVSGFYAEWSSSISTDDVKVLTPDKEQKILTPEGCTIDPPRLGGVGECALMFTRRSILAHPKAEPAKPDEAEEDLSGEAAYRNSVLRQQF
ncbi:MAG: hypothetical protein ABI612_16515 [Betaproteobacteria bacterium]